MCLWIQFFCWIAFLIESSAWPSPSPLENWVSMLPNLWPSILHIYVSLYRQTRKIDVPTVRVIYYIPFVNTILWKLGQNFYTEINSTTNLMAVSNGRVKI